MIISSNPYAKTLTDALRVESEIKQILPRRRLSLTISNVQYCYLILQGSITVHRESDDINLTTVNAPALIGIGNLAGIGMDVYIKMQSTCEIGIITLEKARQVIVDNNLWENLSLHMMVISSKLFASGQLLSAPSSYQIICAQLQELMSEEESLRLSTIAVNYILNKTTLSRSGVMRILSGLREGGYITINRGILLSINKLPDEY
jgi:CRP-like cAMP-binding protein